jgi:methyl-galactoside transport system substrate-binding protein
MKKAILIALIASMAMMTGCQKKAAETAAAAPMAKESKVVIGANIYNFQDNFMNGVMKPVLESYAAELGAEIQIVDSEGQQATLNNQVDIFITKGVDVLAINLADPASAQSIIDKAKKADIPLILFNKEGSKEAMASYDKVWYVGTYSAE